MSDAEHQQTSKLQNENDSIDKEADIVEQAMEDGVSPIIDGENEFSVSISDNRLCCICSIDAAVMKCSGADPHGFCLECFLGYAKSSFEFNSEYERVREHDSLRSLSGQLPCPFFINAKCNCTAIDETEFLRCFDEETFQMWRKADRRVHAKTTMSEDIHSDIQAEESKKSPLETLEIAVKEALVSGCTVSCPKCKTKGEKDDKCIHIKCDICYTHWCYCCGQARELSSSTCRCDSISAYIESNPGWGNFAIGTESCGQGALHEFHRQRTIYLLRQLKEKTERHLWNNLRKKYPNILDDVPTIGRCIDWNSIDSAVLPTFGRSRESTANHTLGIDDNEQPTRIKACERLSTILQNVGNLPLVRAFTICFCLTIVFFFVAFI